MSLGQAQPHGSRGIHDIDGGRLEDTSQNPVLAGKQRVKIRAGQRERPRCANPRAYLEVDAGDGGQRPQAADERLGQIESGDILHDHPAAGHLLACGSDVGHADDGVPRRAMLAASRAAEIAGDHAPHRRHGGKGRIQIQGLTVLSQEPRQVAPEHTRLDADGQVLGFVLEDAVQRQRGEADSRCGERAALTVFGERSAQLHRLAFFRQRTQFARQRLRIFGPEGIHEQFSFCQIRYDQIADMRYLVLLLTTALWAAAPSTAIKVNQAGYPSRAPKLALVVSAQAEGSFTLRRADGDAAIFQGRLAPPVEDADSGDAVRAADFSSFTREGEYYLDVDGVGRSWPFVISRSPYRRAYYLALRSFYGQRCGTAVDLGPEFPGYKYEACHKEGAYHASSGKSGPHVSRAGWHDAGDYGRYIVNSGIATGTLLWTWDLFGDSIRDIRLNIPESNNRVPDILDEIRWNLEWMLTMQDEDGGVWHKQTSEQFCGFVMPDQDHSVSVVIGTGRAPFKSSCATADFAAVTALAARLYAPYDRAFSESCLRAAEKAWGFLELNPAVLFNNPQGVGTGAYGDRDCSDERLWAAAELFRATGGRPYDEYFRANYEAQMKRVGPAAPPNWGNVAALGLWAYALDKRAETATRSAITAASLSWADEIVRRTAANGYRVSLTTRDYVWGSNGVVSNYGLQLLVANWFRRDGRYVKTARDNLHYLLGRNTHSLSFLTQVGANPFRHPHHRPSGADANPEPWPGLLSGGPLARPADPDLRKLAPNLPPAKTYADVQESYSSNENAINWNAPLVFLLAGLLNER